MKTQVYSWRVSPETKSSLEREARRRKTTVSAVLDAAVENWLSNGQPAEDAEEQARLHAEADQCIGLFANGEARGAESAGETVRQRLRRRHAR